MSSEDEDIDMQREEQDEDDSTELKPALKKSRKEQRDKKKFDFERNERTVFVGNLPSTMDHRDVEKLFKSCGPIESARIRSVVPEKEKLPPKVALITQRIHPKVNSVNAYVVFAKADNDDCIKKALAMNGKEVNKHHIRVDRAQHPNSKRMTLTSRKKSVFVGNLRFDLRDDDLIAHFSKAGQVDYVRLVRDRATGLGKGFGFVKFTERAAVKEALKLNDTDFKGRQLRVKKVDQDMKLDEGKGTPAKLADTTRNGGTSKQVQNKHSGGRPKESSQSRKPIAGYERRQEKKELDKSRPENQGKIQQRNQEMFGHKKFEPLKNKNKKHEKRVKFDLKDSSASKHQSKQMNKRKATKKDKKTTLKRKLKGF